MIEEVLIQWQGQTIVEATWEPKDSVLEAFPNLDLEDKIFSNRGSDVTHEELKCQSPVVECGLVREDGLLLKTLRPKRNYKRPCCYST